MLASRPSMAAGEHYRTHERRPVRLGALVRQDGGVWSSRGLVVDLSLGGACVETGQRLEPGSPLILEILAPTLWDPLVLRGRVAWAVPAIGKQAARFGLRFVPEEGPALFALFEVLAAHAYE